MSTPTYEELMTTKQAATPTYADLVSERNPVSKTESALRGAGQGASLGFGDEAYALGAGLRAALTPGSTGFKQNYNEAEEEMRAKNAQAESDNPSSYNAGKIAGETPAYIAGGEAVGLGKTGSLISKILKGATVGAGIGGVEGAGEGEGDAKDQALNSLYHAGGGAVGGVIGELGGAVSGGIARNMAPKAVGAMKSILKKLTPEAREEVSNYLLGNESVPGQQTIIKPGFFSTDKALERNEANAKLGGKNISDVLTHPAIQPVSPDTVTNVIKKSTPEVVGPYTQPSMNAVDDAVKQFQATAAKRSAESITPTIGKTAQGALGEPIGESSITHDPLISLENVNKFKSDVGRQASWQPMDAGEQVANDTNKNIYGNLKNFIENKIAEPFKQNSQASKAVDKIKVYLTDKMTKAGKSPAEIAEAMSKLPDVKDPANDINKLTGGTPEELQQMISKLEEGNYLYRNAKNTDDMLTNKANQEAGNNMLGLGGKLLAGGVAGHDPLAGGAALGASVVGDKYGAANTAYFANQASKSKLGLFPQLSQYITNGVIPSNDAQASEDELSADAQAAANNHSRDFPGS